MKKKVILVDLEGTLTDCSERLHFLKNKQYDEWNAGLVFDPPNKILVEFVKNLSAHYRIIITTAKENQYDGIAKAWIKRHCDFDYYLWFSKSEKFSKESSVEVKKRHLNNILLTADVILAIDDRSDVCDMYRSENIFTINATAFLSNPFYESFPVPPSDKFTPLEPPIVKPQKARKPTETPEKHEKPFKSNKTIRFIDIIDKAGKTYMERNKAYSNSYMTFGRLADGLWPQGLVICGEKAWIRFGLLFQSLVKLSRNAQSFVDKGKTNVDSSHDLGVYSFMLEKVETEFEMEEDKSLKFEEKWSKK